MADALRTAHQAWTAWSAAPTPTAAAAYVEALGAINARMAADAAARNDLPPDAVWALAAPALQHWAHSLLADESRERRAMGADVARVTLGLVRNCAPAPAHAEAAVYVCFPHARHQLDVWRAVLDAALSWSAMSDPQRTLVMLT